MENAEIIKRNDELFAELKKYPEDTKAYRDIVSKIIINNRPLVVHIAQRHFRAMGPALDQDDLIAEGLCGLARAIELFKSEKGTFGNYAGATIEGKILRCLKRERKYKCMPSLQDNTTNDNSDELLLESTIASPVDIEADMIEKDEQGRQLAWLKEHLDQLSSPQKRVITAKYLSGEASLVGKALAKKLKCTKQNISYVEESAVRKLRKMYYESHPEEIDPRAAKIEMTREEKIALKDVLKNLIETKLSPRQKEVMLCKFYSTTEMSYRQTAQAINATENAVMNALHLATKKLCILCEGVKDKKHLKSILESRTEESAKEC